MFNIFTLGKAVYGLEMINSHLHFDSVSSDSEFPVFAHLSLDKEFQNLGMRNQLLGAFTVLLAILLIFPFMDSQVSITLGCFSAVYLMKDFMEPSFSF